MSIQTIANQFFEACETGKGWDVCKAWCHDDASFSAQADILAEVTTVAAYCDWMKGFFIPVPDAHYEIKATGYDEQRNIVTFYGVIEGTHTGNEPLPATGKRIKADYVYAIEFDGDKVKHITKIWNDGHSLRQLGWA